MSKVKIQVLKTDSPFKVLDISGEPGDRLENHKVNEEALLLMRSGNVIYKEENRTEVLAAGEACHIPAEVFHNLTCSTYAKLFVIMSNKTKMKFES